MKSKLQKCCLFGLTLFFLLVLPRVSLKQQQWKPSLYESEPRLSNISYNNRCYSSMNNVQKSHSIRPVSTKHFQSSVLKNSINSDYDTSYTVDSPRLQSKTLTNQSTLGYLNAFLLKKQQQQSIHSQNVKQLIAQFEKSTTTSRPKSAPLMDQLSLVGLKSTKNILHQPTHDTNMHISDKSSQLYSKLEWQNYNNDILDKQINDTIDRTPSSRINIGITLDSRLRKTPVLDMLRSTTMRSDIIEQQSLNRTNSLKHSFIPIARF